MKKIMISGLITLGLLAVLSTSSFAGNDPAIKGDLRTGIKNSMNDFIQAKMINDTYHVFDAVTGTMLNLRLKELHSGIVKKGNFYVSCADFTDTQGRLVDLDFLVMTDDGSFKTVQGVVHAIDGKKRKYHLE